MASPIPPPIQGSTLFLGDSITVGLQPFVAVNGPKGTIAEGGKTADWLLKQVRLADAPGSRTLDVANAVMLIGTNDIGDGRTAAKTFDDISATWTIVKHHGARLIVMTVPPFKGYLGYTPRYASIKAKQQELNRLIRASAIPDLTILLDELVADPADPERLARAYDDGDHLHLRKPALGAIINAAAAGLPPPAPGFPLPSAPSAEVSSTNLVPYLVLGGIVVAGATVLLARKPHSRSRSLFPRPSRT